MLFLRTILPLTMGALCVSSMREEWTTQSRQGRRGRQGRAARTSPKESSSWRTSPHETSFALSQVHRRRQDRPRRRTSQSVNPRRTSFSRSAPSRSNSRDSWSKGSSYSPSPRFTTKFRKMSLSNSDSAMSMAPSESADVSMEPEELPTFENASSEFQFADVDEMYYTHGYHPQVRGFDRLQIQFRNGSLPGYEITPTIYDTVFALLFGNEQQPEGLLQRISAAGHTIYDVKASVLQKALYETMAAFKKHAGWAGMPEVVTHSVRNVNGEKERRLFSNNNRSLYVLQCIAKVFDHDGAPIPLIVPYTSRDKISSIHAYSEAHSPDQMVVQFKEGYQSQSQDGHPHNAQIQKMFAKRLRHQGAAGQTLHELNFTEMVHERIAQQGLSTILTKHRRSRNVRSRRSDRSAW